MIPKFRSDKELYEWLSRDDSVSRIDLPTRLAAIDEVKDLVVLGDIKRLYRPYTGFPKGAGSISGDMKKTLHSATSKRLATLQDDLQKRLDAGEPLESITREQDAEKELVDGWIPADLGRDGASDEKRKLLALFGYREFDAPLDSRSRLVREISCPYVLKSICFRTGYVPPSQFSEGVFLPGTLPETKQRIEEGIEIAKTGVAKLYELATKGDMAAVEILVDIGTTEGFQAHHFLEDPQTVHPEFKAVADGYLKELFGTDDLTTLSTVIGTFEATVEKIREEFRDSFGDKKYLRKFGWKRADEISCQALDRCYELATAGVSEAKHLIGLYAVEKGSEAVLEKARSLVKGIDRGYSVFEEGLDLEVRVHGEHLSKIEHSDIKEGDLIKCTLPDGSWDYRLVEGRHESSDPAYQMPTGIWMKSKRDIGGACAIDKGWKYERVDPEVAERVVEFLR